MRGVLLTIEERMLDGLHAVAFRLGSGARMAPHLVTGLRGERAALFELRRRGYRIVARRWTSGKLRGDVDLIGWDGAQLCFVEVKTRSRRDERTPAETAVDREKQRMLRRLAGAYVKGFPLPARDGVRVRFDVVAVYLDGTKPEVEMFRDAFR